MGFSPDVINESLENSDEFIGEWLLATAWPTALGSSEAQLRALLATASMPKFPGAILPWPRGSERTIFYAVSNDGDQWRRLNPLVKAFAGVTVTTFDGQVTKLKTQHRPELLLLNKRFRFVARLVSNVGQMPETFLLTALSRLVNLVNTLPFTSQQPPESTSRLLGRIEGSIADGDYQASVTMLAQLKSEDRLDGLNIKYLEIRILHAFRDWGSILSLPEIDDLIAAPRPGAVTAAILDALYFVNAREIENINDLDEVTKAVAADLLIEPRPRLGEGGERLASLLDKETLVERDVQRSKSQPVASFLNTGLFETLFTASLSDSISLASATIAEVNSLEPSYRSSVLQIPIVAKLWERITSRTNATNPPLSWLDWLQRLGESQFANYLDFAKDASSQWSVEEALPTLESANELATSLGASRDKLAEDRLADCLPILARWVMTDKTYPRADFFRLYDSLWTLIVMNVRLGNSDRESAASLFEGLLSSGPTATQYRALLDDALALIAEPGRRTIYWLLRFVEVTLDEPSSDGEARTAFWHVLLARVAHLRPQLTILQLAAIDLLSETVGLDAPRDSANKTPPAAYVSALEGKRLAIYTLTERAARQAESALLQVSPTLKISLHSDYGGSAQLKAAAENADLFVIVTGSATHAATDFIRAHRSADRLLYAAGKGMSGILRAVDEHVASNA